MEQNRKYFDAPYGIASAAIAATGDTIVCTSGGYYHGLAAIPGTANYTITIYDHISTAAGNKIDVVLVASAGTGARITNYIPVVAKNGIVVTITATGNSATIFYSPNG